MYGCVMENKYEYEYEYEYEHEASVSDVQNINGWKGMEICKLIEYQHQTIQQGYQRSSKAISITEGDQY